MAGWNKRTKFIVITGGVLSGMGKGVVSASIGRILSNGLKLIPIKCDGYLNVDPGTMNPFEHGEVFVLDDGAEVDMDFGHYERFLNISTKKEWNLTMGKIYLNLIEKERKGLFLGQTVQTIPHATNEIKDWFYRIVEAEKADLALIEIGGTVGDIENMLFLDAVRQMRLELGQSNIVFVHLSYVPVLEAVGEQKTRPTRESVDILRERGIAPDIVVGRSKERLTEKSKSKISLFCNVPKEAVISDPNIETVYELPLVFEEEHLPEILCGMLGLKMFQDLSEWRRLVNRIKNSKEEMCIAICGKYTGLHDSYASIIEALVHSAAHVNRKATIKWIETTDVDTREDIKKKLKGVCGVIVPGGFGGRGAEGKIKAIEYARENNLPFLGLCYGLQLAVVEFARNVCNLKDANSTEIDPKTKNPVIDILPEQKTVSDKGATMRLGSWDAFVKEKTHLQKIYGEKIVSERHRHRFEVNPEYHELLQEKGLVFSATDKSGRLVEFIELPKHKFFIATQAHPELKSKLESPSPVFLEFVKACVKSP